MDVAEEVLDRKPQTWLRSRLGEARTTHAGDFDITCDRYTFIGVSGGLKQTMVALGGSELPARTLVSFPAHPPRTLGGNL